MNSKRYPLCSGGPKAFKLSILGTSSEDQLYFYGIMVSSEVLNTIMRYCPRLFIALYIVSCPTFSTLDDGSGFSHLAV